MKLIITTVVRYHRVASTLQPQLERKEKQIAKYEALGFRFTRSTKSYAWSSAPIEEWELLNESVVIEDATIEKLSDLAIEIDEDLVIDHTKSDGYTMHVTIYDGYME